MKLALSTADTIVKLMLRNADTFINLEVYSYFTTFISILSLSRNRYSYYRKSAAFRNGIDTHHIYFNTKRPLQEVYAQVMLLLQVEAIEQTSKFPFLIADEDKQKVNEFFRNNNVERFVIINSNASDLMPERKWLVENWLTTIEYLLKETPFTVLLSGSSAEKAGVEEQFSEVLYKHADRVKNVAGDFGLAAYTFLLRHAEFMISNDSGPLHLAFSQKTKCISLWGPTDPAHLALKSKNNYELYKEVYCSPCLHHADKPPCKGNNICMKNITSAEVIEKIQLLQNS
ncbi:glycosyltransferase family 9 protein [Lacibacter luteus]|uniref:glycosyltransferase family 9 protein n=1 Tax=Lacibacter luteus TaxID=2508719 RepID=UPI0013E99A34|nr:glycosyltransferase family 9 protein [Lacibacter luteus]